jgi:hypothetical protein
VSPRVPHPRQQLVFLPDPRNVALGKLWNVRVVAGTDIDRLAVRPQDQRVRPMLARRAAGFQDDVRALEAVIAVRVGQAIQETFALRPRGLTHHVQTVERVEQALSVSDLVADHFDARLGSFFLGNRDAVEPARLV